MGLRSQSRESCIPSYLRPSVSSRVLVLVVLSLLALCVVASIPETRATSVVRGADATSGDCTASCLQISFNLSLRGGGILFVSAVAGSPISQNETLSISPGTYNLTAVAASGYDFVRWVTDGEIQVMDPTSSQTTVTVTSSLAVVEAVFEPLSGPSLFDQPLFWAIAGALITAGIAIVALAVRGRLRTRTPPGDRPAATPSPTPLPPEARGEAAELGAWSRNALTAWEGVSEDELWPAVKASAFPAGSLLCFTFGRTERLVKRYGLDGASVVRISRVETSPGSVQVAPTNLDTMADLIEKHLRTGDGRGVVLPSLEALILANSTRDVVRLVEVARDLALDRRGSILFTVNPAAVSAADLAQIERGARRAGG